MTLPDERYRAIREAEVLLLELARPGDLPRKTELRRRIRYVLRHYPSRGELHRLARRCPDILAIAHEADEQDIANVKELFRA